MLDREQASRLLQKLYDFAERIPHLSECNIEYGFDAIVAEFTLTPQQEFLQCDKIVIKKGAITLADIGHAGQDHAAFARYDEAFFTDEFGTKA